jgi:hypothetical protein
VAAAIAVVIWPMLPVKAPAPLAAGWATAAVLVGARVGGVTDVGDGAMVGTAVGEAGTAVTVAAIGVGAGAEIGTAIAALEQAFSARASTTPADTIKRNFTDKTPHVLELSTMTLYQT